MKCLWDSKVCESDTQKGGLKFGGRNMRLINISMAFTPLELDEITKGVSVGREEELWRDWKEVDGEKEKKKKNQENVVSRNSRKENVSVDILYNREITWNGNYRYWVNILQMNSEKTESCREMQK